MSNIPERISKCNSAWRWRIESIIIICNNILGKVQAQRDWNSGFVVVAGHVTVLGTGLPD